MPQSPKPGQPDPPMECSGTLVETEDDVRQALLLGQKGRQPRPAIAAELSPAPPIGPPIQPTAPRGRVPSHGAAAGCRADGV